MGFYEQLRGLMCQNRGLLNTREQRNNGGNIRQGQLIYLFIVMFHKETAAPKEFIFAAWVWIVPVFLIAHRDIPSAQLMAPLRSNLVQYSPSSPGRGGEGGVRYWFYFYKTFSRWSPPRPRCFLPQSLPGPAHQTSIAQTASTSPLSAALCSGHVSSPGDGSSYDPSPVFRKSDTLVLGVRE